MNIRDRPKTNTVCRQWHAQELQAATSSRTTTTKRCSSTIILTTWGAVVTSPTWTAKYRSISNTFHLGKYSLKNATTLGTRLISSTPRSLTRKQVCTIMVRGTMNRGLVCGWIQIRCKKNTRV